MASSNDAREYLLHTIGEGILESKRLVTLIRETLDRRFRPDDVVESAVANAECELDLLHSKFKKLEKTRNGSNTDKR